MTIETFTEGDAADVSLCKRVSDVLMKHYPGYPWMVGMWEAQTGVLVIDLPPQYKPTNKLRQAAYLMHIFNAYHDENVVRAGGEWLERLRLERGAAPDDADLRAQENGLDLTNWVEKSRTGGVS